MNQLTRVIPWEIAGLTFLASLDLSYNNLVGRIPVDSQFQTFSASSFEGNQGLCGFPLSINCINTDGNDDVSPTLKGNQKKEIDWDYVSAALGFSVGLGSILWLLWGSQSLREKFSEKIDQVLLNIFDRHDKKRRHGGRVLKNKARGQ